MALILLIDRSGSMDESSGGVTKMAMAREAAAQAVGALKSNDQIGVIAFDTDPTWIVPVTQVGPNMNDYRYRISRLEASGGTDIYSAIQAGYNAIRPLRATQKHIILLTDGQSWKGPYQSLLQRLQQEQITLSTIAIGSDADTGWLSELARLGSGRYYFNSQFTDLPKIVFREVNAATKVSKVEGDVQPQVSSPSPLLRGVGGVQIPTLGGYVATKPKDSATVVLKSDRGDPLLAQWQYGLGRVVAWTSDSEGLWSSSWSTQPQFSKVWEQAVRWSMAPPVDRGLQLRTAVDGQEATITVDSVDSNGLFVNLADTRAVLTDSEGNRSNIQLEQVAAGRYQATVLALKPGLYRVDVAQDRGSQPRGSETTGFSVYFAPEFRRLGSNDAMLKEIAAMTGGRTISDPSDAFSRDGMAPSSGWQPLWSYLLALALLLLPIEVAVRRIRSLPRRTRPGRGAAADPEGEVVEMPAPKRDDRAA